ncbi:hypothetical protein UA08_03155 [Talaromyces atroroseus]|uniref:FAS1 domain-containing protein n=1 Tax=Talaromyces atroroseus TaxID=1441469 RepID=A0A225B5K1_TALAT|nr:hypothetical protein UA08_03155 [Talaromyces atroroseus]OKL61197.1 hypothetical protein UA08_03155 [Talaromyces atroroseus]
MKFSNVLAPIVFLGMSHVVSAETSITNAEKYLSSVGITDTGITGTQATSLAYALESAYSSIETRSQYTSAWSVMATAISSDTFESLASSGYKHIVTTAEPAWFTGLPDSVKSELLLEQSQLDSVEMSVLSKSTSTSKGDAPQNTLAAGGFFAAGLLGVAALL